MKVIYSIDNEEFTFDCPDKQIFVYGENRVLSTKNTDITFNQKWYQDGFNIDQFISEVNFANLKNGISKTLRSIMQNIGLSVDGFNLENYHSFVRNDVDHFQVVDITRDLFPEDFSFDIKKLIISIEDQTGLKLTDLFPYSDERVHIIIRINRPNSNDFNPPHQDIDDNETYEKGFLNIWIPICGVTDDSSLCYVPGSHLFNQSLVLKSITGGEIGGNKYRVKMIKQWNYSNSLVRAKIKECDVLYFSPYLIHGLGYNKTNKTRISLEFRLFNRD